MTDLRMPRGRKQMPRHAENAMRRQESENAGLGEAKQHHPAFLVASISSPLLQNSQYMTSGQYYEGNIFLIALLFIFKPCRIPGWLVMLNSTKRPATAATP
jgi:hypothetical protein